MKARGSLQHTNDGGWSHMLTSLSEIDIVSATPTHTGLRPAGDWLAARPAELPGGGMKMQSAAQSQERLNQMAYGICWLPLLHDISLLQYENARVTEIKHPKSHK